jgi:hypothetical protein
MLCEPYYFSNVELHETNLMTYWNGQGRQKWAYVFEFIMSGIVLNTAFLVILFIYFFDSRTESGLKLVGIYQIERGSTDVSLDIAEVYPEYLLRVEFYDEIHKPSRFC